MCVFCLYVRACRVFCLEIDLGNFRNEIELIVSQVKRYMDARKGVN